MRKYLVCIMAVMVAMGACRPETFETVEYKMGVDELVFTKNEGKQDFFVQTTADVKAVSSEPEWCIVEMDKSYTSDKIKKFNVNVTANASTSERNAIVTVTIAGNIEEEIKVVQRAEQIILLSESAEVSCEPQDYELELEAVVEYEVDSEAYWVQVKSKDASKIVLALQENRLVSSRSAEIVIKTQNDRLVFKLFQTANSVLTLTPDKTGVESDAKTLMKKMTLGINLGNTLEASGGETAWGAPKTTEEIILYFKELGFNAVRIPCSWNQYLEEGEGYVVKEDWMVRVREVVDYVVDNDMYAILNIHNDGGWLETDIPNGYNKEVDAKQKAIWTQIALMFRDYDEHLVFAGANEPNVHDEDDLATLMIYEQTFIDAVRSTGGRNAYRVLVFQGPSTDINMTDEIMHKLPEDSVEGRLAAEVHYYTPPQFCILSTDASWGGVSYFWGEDQKEYATGAYAGKWNDWANEDYLANQMAKMKKKFWDRGFPVIIGEFGVADKTFNLSKDPSENERAKEGFEKSRAAYYGAVVRESKAHGCVPFHWHCEGGLISRKELRLTDPMSYGAMIEAAKTQYPN